MPNVAARLFDITRERRIDIHEAIRKKIRPYSIESVIKILDKLFEHIPDLSVFNEHADAVPEFLLACVNCMKFPVAGDAIGITKICRLTKSDTQSALDSKHIQGITDGPRYEFNVEKDILEELALFSVHMHLFELANRHKVATVFMSHDTSVEYLMGRLSNAGILERGNPYNKGRRAGGDWAYLTSFRYIIVEDRGSLKVLYRSLNDLFLLLRRVPLRCIVAFSDVRCLFKKTGITCTFFNMLQLAQRQLFVHDDSKYEKDVTTLLVFMFCRGELLPMNREGLAKNKDNPPIDVLSFEAMKRNCSRIITGPFRGDWHDIYSSSELIFSGQQFREGTGGPFELRNKSQ